MKWNLGAMFNSTSVERSYYFRTCSFKMKGREDWICARMGLC